MPKFAPICILLLLQTSNAFASLVDAPFSSWLQELLHEPATTGNSVELKIDGPEIYPTLLSMIRDARATLDLSMFLWCDDTSGLAIAQALYAASSRGVRVRLIDDWFNFKQHLIAFSILKTAGSIPLVFNPPNWGLSEINSRLHEKLMIADGEKLWVSGANFCDEYMIGGKHGLWHDLALVAQGPVAARAQERYDQTWNWMAETEDSVRQGYSSILESPETSPQVERIHFTSQRDSYSAPPAGHATALLQYQQPYLRPGATSRFIATYAELIKRASRRVIVYIPYLIPDAAFKEALLESAKRGVRVDVLTNAMPTNDLGSVAAGAQDAEYEAMLAAGVHLHEMIDTTLHGKAVLVDDKALSLGSHNFTTRSFHHNSEAGIVTDDPGAIDRFEQMAESDFELRAREVRLADVRAAKKRSPSRRFWQTISSWLGHFF